MNPETLVRMGRVGRPHGVAGELKVFPDTDDPARFAAVGRVFVGASPEKARAADVAGVRFQYPRGSVVVLLRLHGVGSREDAAGLAGQYVFASTDDLPPLEDGEAYLHDLVGLDVFELGEDDSPAAAPLGTVRDVLEGGAQLLFQVARPEGEDVLIPDAPAFVARLDLSARRLYVRLPEGLVA
ncbi:MAG: ribosome maturation factor RimM [Rubricoccaceae bacterium]